MESRILKKRSLDYILRKGLNRKRKRRAQSLIYMSSVKEWAKKSLTSGGKPYL
jgi:hypothetical protein